MDRGKGRGNIGAVNVSMVGDGHLLELPFAVILALLIGRVDVLAHPPRHATAAATAASAVRREIYLSRVVKIECRPFLGFYLFHWIV